MISPSVSPSRPNEVKPQPSSRCLRARSFWFQCEPACGRCVWWALERRPSGAVGVVDAECALLKAHQTLEQVPVNLALLTVVPTVNINPYRLSF